MTRQVHYYIENSKEPFITETIEVPRHFQRMGMWKLRSLIESYNREEISISKFLEEINNHFLKNEIPMVHEILIDSEETFYKYWNSVRMAMFLEGQPTEFKKGETVKIFSRIERWALLPIYRTISEVEQVPGGVILHLKH